MYLASLPPEARRELIQKMRDTERLDDIVERMINHKIWEGLTQDIVLEIRIWEHSLTRIYRRVLDRAMAHSEM
jgi:hypothetical protein